MSVTLSTRASCSWAASTSDPGWLSIDGSASSGTGPATVSVNAAANGGAARTATVTIGGQPFTVTQAAYPWSNQDIGAVGVGGSTTASGGVYTVTGAGADVWGTADALQYRVSDADRRRLDHRARRDGAEHQRVGQGRRHDPPERSTPGAAQGFMLVSYSKGLAFQRRTAANGGVSTSGATGASGAAPYWVRLDRVGNAITAYQSADGVTWTLVDSDTIPMSGTIYIGLGVSSHTHLGDGDRDVRSRGHRRGHAGVADGACRRRWTHQDVGAVGVAGSAWFSTRHVDVRRQRRGRRHLRHRRRLPLRLQAAHRRRRHHRAGRRSVQNTNAWVKAGVMIRETLDPGSAQAMMLVSYSKGQAFQRRRSPAALSTSTAGPAAGRAAWVQARTDREYRQRVLDRQTGVAGPWSAATRSRWVPTSTSGSRSAVTRRRRRRR